MDEDTWLSYRDVIYFLLGTERAHETWKGRSPFFSSDDVKMVDTMMEGAPPIDCRDKLEVVSQACSLRLGSLSRQWG
jgi:hypothetical protein